MNQLGWAAGFFDGEGHIGINRGIRVYNGIDRLRHTLQVGVSQNSKAALERFQTILGEETGRIYLAKGRCHTLRYASATAERVLNRLLPHLFVKKKQAILACNFRRLLRLRTGQRQLSNWEQELRDWYWLQLKKVNQAS